MSVPVGSSSLQCATHGLFSLFPSTCLLGAALAVLQRRALQPPRGLDNHKEDGGAAQGGPPLLASLDIPLVFLLVYRPSMACSS